MSEAAIGERREFDGDTLYRTHVRAIYCFIYSRVGNRETAEDLTSEVFVRALAHLDPTRDERSIVAWLYRVARNIVNDYWRIGTTAHVITLDDMRNVRSIAVVPDSGKQDRTARRAMDLLNALPPNYRTVLQCRLLEGLSVAETAQRMATSSANVKVLQHRALKRAAELEQGISADA